MSTKLPEIDIRAWLTSTERQILHAGDTTIALLRCRFDASLERVWTACSDRGQLRRWFADVSGELREGARLTFDVGAPYKLTSQLLQCEPFHKLLLTWSYPGREIDEVEIRLTSDGDGALMELEHRSDDKSEWWLGAGSGWEYALIRLRVHLQGNAPSIVSAEELDQKLGPLWTAAGRT